MLRPLSSRGAVLSCLLPQQVRTAMRNDTESPFSLTLTQSNLRLQVLRFNGREALNQPYRFDLELIGLAPPINPDTLLGQPAFLRLDGESDRKSTRLNSSH